MFEIVDLVKLTFVFLFNSVNDLRRLSHFVNFNVLSFVFKMMSQVFMI